MNEDAFLRLKTTSVYIVNIDERIIIYKKREPEDSPKMTSELVLFIMLGCCLRGRCGSTG